MTNRSERFWNRIARGSGEAAELGETDRKTIAATQQYLKRGDVVLDFGCGTGELTLALAQHVQAVYGLDTSPGMIAVAKARASRAQTDNVEFQQQGLDDFDPGALAKGGFDVVTAFNVLHYIEDTQQVVQRIRQLLPAEGLFISATACAGERRSLLGMLLRAATTLRVVPAMKFFKRSALEGLLLHSGFQIVATEQLSGLPEYLIVAQKIGEL